MKGYDWQDKLVMSACGIAALVLLALGLGWI